MSIELPKAALSILVLGLNKHNKEYGIQITQWFLIWTGIYNLLVVHEQLAKGNDILITFKKTITQISLNTKSYNNSSLAKYKQFWLPISNTT